MRRNKLLPGEIDEDMVKWSEVKGQSKLVELSHSLMSYISQNSPNE